MKITRQTAEELVLEESTFWLAWFLVIVTLPLLYAAIFGSDKRIFTPVGCLLLFAVAIARKSRVVFDAGTRRVQWRKVAWLRAKTGSLAFDEITDVGIQSTMGGNMQALTYRLTISSQAGTMPLAAGYGTGSEAYSAMRIAILSMIGRGGAPRSHSPETARPQTDAVDLVVLELVRSRQFIPAVELLRTMNPQMGLYEAKRRVEAIRSGLGGKA